MKLLAIALTAAAFLTAGAAAASDRVTDVDYLRASRCKGLATSLPGVVDGKAIDSYLKSASSARAAYILNRADREYQRGKRDGKSPDRRERMTAELTGTCSAYLGAPGNVVKQ
jgi:hypothetical protein